VGSVHRGSMGLFQVTMLANDMVSTVRQGLSQQVRGRWGRAKPPVWANRMLLLRADGNFSERGQHRLAGVSRAVDPTGNLQAAWQVKEQLRTLLNTVSLVDAAAGRERAGGPRRTRPDAGSQQALPAPLPLVGRDGSPIVTGPLPR
jgi:hypothetical protein